MLAPWAYIASVLDAYQCGEWSGQRPDLSDLAQRLAGGTLVALEHLLGGGTRLAVHLAGAKHHAQRDRSSGFCVFADLAIAARIANASEETKRFGAHLLRGMGGRLRALTNRPR